MKRSTKILKLTCLSLIFFTLFVTFRTQALAADPLIELNLNQGEDPSVVPNLQILFLLTIIALIPAILMTTTAFTRIIIVLSFIRSALGVQQTPPNQVLIGLALFLTLFVMGPTLNEVNEVAWQPYTQGEIGQEEVIEKALDPMREFMFNQVGADELQLFADIAGIEAVVPASADTYPSQEEIPTRVLIPAFIISEIKTAFILGFIIYVPFIVIDMVVASTLMSMGMMMLPPVMISLPFKILLFILVDGWNLLIGEIVKTFH